MDTKGKTFLQFAISTLYVFIIVSSTSLYGVVLSRGETPSLYTLIPEKQTSAGTFLTTHTYDLSGVSIVVSVYVVCC